MYTRPLHTVKTEYIESAVNLCGNNISLAAKVTGLNRETITSFLPKPAGDHIKVDPWHSNLRKWVDLERIYVLNTYKYFEYNQKATRGSLGMSDTGLLKKLQRLGIPSSNNLVNITKPELLDSAKKYSSLNAWFEAEAAMVVAAHRLQAVKRIKEILGW